MPNAEMIWDNATREHGERVIQAGDRLVAGHGVLSHSLHGNISIRLPQTDRFLLTGVGALDALTLDSLALLSVDGAILGGNIGPASHEIIQMHAAVYRRRADVNAVIHTHSPYVTAYAIANEPIAPTYEAMVRFDITETVPVAEYGPRGSERSVTNIVNVVNDTNKACLLANHGLLVWDANIEMATHLVVVLEEAAQFSLMARILGGAKEIPAAAIQETIARRDQFAGLAQPVASDDD
jgi:L-ribulose-5-phosphate 4-epimerase